MKNKTCPICGENTLKQIDSEQIITEPFGGQKILKVKEYYCETCESKGDFFDENEDNIKKNIIELKNRAVNNILENFRKNKISLSAIERALELPQRTLTRWKNLATKPSSTGIALLKFLRIFPWLLEVAENKYNYSIAQKIHMNAAFQKMLNQMNFDKNDFTEAGIVTTAKSAFIYMNFEKTDEQYNMSENNILINNNLLVNA